MVITPLSLPEMHVAAAILENSQAGRDSVSIAHAAMASCSVLISATAAYRTLDRLERRHVVTWEPGEGSDSAGNRKDRHYRVTVEGMKLFDRSLGLLPRAEQANLAAHGRGYLLGNPDALSIDDAGDG
jgi:DNA-binding MarR family transcriptional regulator